MPERKLLDQISDLARLRHMSLRTEKAYRNWAKRYILFHDKRHPRDMGVDEVRAFLTHLAVHDKVAASTQNQAFNALLFLYRNVLNIKLEALTGVERALPSRNLPVVFTRDEANAIITYLRGDNKLIASLLYGSGLRIMEAVRLRIKDIDFQRHEIMVRDGKGEKDRVTMLPQSLAAPLLVQIESVSRLHEHDLGHGYGEVYLPYALDRKYKNAATELIWQDLFPAPNISTDTRTEKARRHHVSEKNVQRAVKTALLKAGVRKNGTCHSFRHSFA